MVLTTAHLATLGILYLYFKKFKKDFSVVMISASMDIGWCTQIVNRFYGREESIYYKSASKVDILLSTTTLVGTRLNITTTNNFV